MLGDQELYKKYCALNQNHIGPLTKLKGTQPAYFDQLFCTNLKLLLVHLSKRNHLAGKISTTNLDNH